MLWTANCKKEGQAFCFTAGLLCTMAKDEECSEDSYYAETHCRVDKPFKCFFLPGAATLGFSSNKQAFTNFTMSWCNHFCRLIVFFVQSLQVWGFEESKELNATFLHTTGQYTVQLMGYLCVLFCHPEVNDIYKISRYVDSYQTSLVPRPHPLTRKVVWWPLSDSLVVLSQQSWYWTTQWNSATSCNHALDRPTYL